MQQLSQYMHRSACPPPLCGAARVPPCCGSRYSSSQTKKLLILLQWVPLRVKFGIQVPFLVQKTIPPPIAHWLEGNAIIILITIFYLLSICFLFLLWSFLLLKHDACCQNIMLWPSRRSNDRVGTNLEALDMGYSYIKSCSKCDYYMQNKALHMKARILPRSHLSQMWQCTSDHKLGDVYHHGSLQTPYRPVKTT
jgi:hypothetical protein